MGDEQDGKRYEDLVAQLRAEDGDDPDLAVFREAAAQHMHAEADRLDELTPEQKLVVWKGAHAIVEDERDRALRDAVYWEAMAENADRERDECQTELEAARAALAAAPRITDNGRGRPTYYLWEPDGTRVELVTLTQWLAEYEELAGLHRRAVEELADAGARAVQEYVREGAAGDAWMTVQQIRYALDQADADHAAEVRRLTVELAIAQDAGKQRLLTQRWDDDSEPPNGTIVVDASHVAWQRRNADAFEVPADRWFQVGQEDGEPWTAATASGPVTVVWMPANGG